MDWNSKMVASYIEYVILNLEKDGNNQFYFWGESLFLEKEYIGSSYRFYIERHFNLHLDSMFGIPNLHPSIQWRYQDALIRKKIHEQGANF